MASFFSKMTGSAKGSIPIEEKLFGFGDTKGRAADKEAGRVREQWREAGEQSEQEYGGVNRNLMNKMTASTDTAKADLESGQRAWNEEAAAIRGEQERSIKDSRTTYSNEVQPRLKGLMEQNQKNSASAMTLEEAMDPNNRVAQATRDLYEKQAQGEGRQGLADVGILQAMGAQATASQMGGTPMTGGQLAALMGQNQAQAGSAYGSTQRRTAALRDAGLAKGFERSDVAYGQGREGVKDYGQSVRSYEDASDRNLGREAAYRKERESLADKSQDKSRRNVEDIFGLESGLTGLEHQVDTGTVRRKEGRQDRYYGGSIEAQMAKAKQARAENAAKQGMFTSGMGILGNLLGGGGGGGAGGLFGGKGPSNSSKGGAGGSPGSSVDDGTILTGSEGSGEGGYYDYGTGTNYPASPDEGVDNYVEPTEEQYQPEPAMGGDPNQWGYSLTGQMSAPQRPKSRSISTRMYGMR